MTEENGAPDEIRVEIDFVEPDPQMAAYANEMVVGHTANEFTMVFYRVLPPMRLEIPEGQDGLTIHAIPVARIIVPVAKLEAFVTTMQKTMDRYHSAKSSEDQD